MAFRYRKKAKFSRPEPVKVHVGEREKEYLTGTVQGEGASDLEERLARGLESANLSYRFQYPVQTAYTLPNADKQVDFVIFTGNRAFPVEVYGPYFHETAGARLKDQVRERHLNDAFDKMGFERLRVVWYWQLYNQEAARETAERLLF